MNYHAITHPSLVLSPSLMSSLCCCHVHWPVIICHHVQVEELYYPALEALLKQQTGASRVHVFDHTQRRGSVR